MYFGVGWNHQNVCDRGLANVELASSGLHRWSDRSTNRSTASPIDRIGHARRRSAGGIVVHRVLPVLSDARRDQLAGR